MRVKRACFSVMLENYTGFIVLKKSESNTYYNIRIKICFEQKNIYNNDDSKNS